jgi:HD-GYP domain-containing protein (c-di-GMP phosphodiesterase class II)
LGLRAEEIDVCARIFAVADAFDAITSDRVYREGRSYEAAARELNKWSNQQFDPEVVEAFHRVPKEDWEELRRLSMARAPNEPVWQPIIQAIDSQLHGSLSSERMEFSL